MAGGRLPERVDVLVVGGGMAGLAAGMVAAENGARVLVVEKGEDPGGSAALSVGMFWAVPDFETLRRRVPLGDPELGRAVVEDYPAAVETIRGMGVPVGDRVLGVMTVGIGYSIDIHALLDHEVSGIERAGGRISCSTSVRRLLADDDGAVTAAFVRGPDGRTATVLADATILATGGFQGAPDLVGAYVGPNADRMLVRSNRGASATVSGWAAPLAAPRAGRWAASTVIWCRARSPNSPKKGTCPSPSTTPTTASWWT